MVVAPFNPLVGWIFNENNFDASGHNINLWITTIQQQQTYASVYQNYESSNQALVLDGGPSYGTSSRVIPFPDQFTIQMIFNHCLFINWIHHFQCRWQFEWKDFFSLPMGISV